MICTNLSDEELFLFSNALYNFSKSSEDTIRDVLSRRYPSFSITEELPILMKDEHVYRFHFAYSKANNLDNCDVAFQVSLPSKKIITRMTVRKYMPSFRPNIDKSVEKHISNLFGKDVSIFCWPPRDTDQYLKVGKYAVRTKVLVCDVTYESSDPAKALDIIWDIYREIDFASVIY